MLIDILEEIPCYINGGDQADSGPVHIHQVMNKGLLNEIFKNTTNLSWLLDRVPVWGTGSKTLITDICTKMSSQISTYEVRLEVEHQSELLFQGFFCFLVISGGRENNLM